jgi:Ca2+/Na+ antiporter
MWIEPDSVNNSALLFLTLIYAVVLYQSSNLISSGSELLLLVPAVASLVGSIVLPILGAVPDGMMTLVSGLGPDAQSEVGIGVGVLAGSTVMLLTFPWFIAVVCGRVPLSAKGEADYKGKGKAGGASGLFDSGVSLGEDIQRNGLMMLGTTLIYLVIQIPASMAESKANPSLNDTAEVAIEASSEQLPALVGLVLSVVGFMAYMFACYKQSQQDDGSSKVIDRIIQGIQANEVSLSAALQFCADESNGTDAGLEEALVAGEKTTSKTVEKIVKPFFRKYDNDNSKTLELSEFKILLSDLGEATEPESLTATFQKFDTDKSGKLDLSEVSRCLNFYMNDKDSRAKIQAQVQKEKAKGAKTMTTYTKKPDGEEDDDEEEEEEEMPEDLRQLSPEEQQARVKRRACWMMALGTFIVLFVSDPFVDVLNVWGDRLGIPAFYVSFVVAPFASNASELLSAYVYAAKKTKASITTALSTLIGAACMNNTFVLAIFFCLVYFKKLAWRFTAETLAIMIVQWIIGLLAVFKKVHSLFFGFVILACYPVCLAIVAGLEAYGLD